MKKVIGNIITKSIGLYFNLAVYLYPKKIAKKAFELFCTPRKGKVQGVQKSFLSNAKDELLESNGVSLQTYRWIGAGPTALLMHGWESNTFRWRQVVAQLQKEDYNIIAFDAPAHGYSSGAMLHVPLYADCAQTVIEYYTPKFIIGHSLGGMTMIYNQYKYKNVFVEKIISLGAPSELSDFMRQYKNILGLSSTMMKHLEAYFISIFSLNFSDFSSPKFANSLNIPGLIIHDELDYVAPFWSSEQVHAVWQNSLFIKTKGLGHSLHQDKVRRQIIDFMKSS